MQRFGCVTTAAAAGLLGACLAQSASAGLVLYEPFNYGSTDVALNEVSGAATGLDGTTYSGAGNYLASGMTFSNLVTTGGQARMPYDSGSIANARGLDFNFTAGSTLYGSFLYVDTGGASNSTAALLFGGSSSNDNNAILDIFGATYNSSGATTGIKTANSGGASATSTGVPTADNDQFLALFQVTNMGTTTGPQTLSLWTLNTSQFDHFKSAGMTAANLNAASTGTGASNVLQKASVDLTGGYVSLNDTNFMRLLNYRYSYNIDEIRLSDASLDEVTPVPEPAAVSLLIGGAALMRRRRRTKL